MTCRLTSYAAFRYDTDDCGSVKEYLEYSGIELPKLHTRGTIGKDFMYQYTRTLVAGEWCATRKDAKASYKQALKAARIRAMQEREHWQNIGRSINDCDYQIMRKAVGGYYGKPGQWLENNAFTTPMEGSEFDAASRLVSLGLVDDCGEWNGGKFYQVSPNGCRALGIPEGRINNARFL